MYHGSSEMKCPVIALKSLHSIAFENNLSPTLNPAKTWYKKAFAEVTMSFKLFYHKSCLTGLIIASAMLYQVGYQASLLRQKSHTYGADYVMQMWKWISL